MIEGIADGQVELSGIKNWELTYAITKEGERHIIELLGGVDVAENTKRMMRLLVKYKILGFEVPETVITFTIIAACLSIVKYYETWATLTEILHKAEP